MYKNIIFDIGNVLVDFHPLAYFRQFFAEDLNQELCHLFFGTETWIQVDQGLVSEEEALQSYILQYPKYEKQLTFMAKEWKHFMTPLTRTQNLMKQLKKQGYRIYLLSNIGEASYSYLKNTYDFFDVIDGAVYSYQEKLVKPDRKIFVCLIDRYQLKPEECIFLDDALKNVECAQSFGICAIHFLQEQQAERTLYTYLKDGVHVTD